MTSLNSRPTLIISEALDDSTENQEISQDCPFIEEVKDADPKNDLSELEKYWISHPFGYTKITSKIEPISKLDNFRKCLEEKRLRRKVRNYKMQYLENFRKVNSPTFEIDQKFSNFSKISSSSQNSDGPGFTKLETLLEVADRVQNSGRKRNGKISKINSASVIEAKRVEKSIGLMWVMLIFLNFAERTMDFSTSCISP